MNTEPVNRGYRLNALPHLKRSTVRKMKLLITALILFVASFFLPFYMEMPGYECALFCMLVWGGNLFITEWQWQAYYFAFTLSHIMMILMPVLLSTVLKHKRIPIGLIVAQIVLLIHVVSFLVMHIAHDIKYLGNTNMGDAIPDINVGYYIWLLSMLLMLVVTVRKRMVDQSSEPIT